MSRLTDLVEQRDAAQEELEGITSAVTARAVADPAQQEVPEEQRTADLTDQEETRSTELLSTIDEIDEELPKLAAAEQRARTLNEARSLIGATPITGDAQVTDEPMIYGINKDGEGSPNSYYADLIRVSTRSPLDPSYVGASKRLGVWAHQVEVEYAQGSKIGKAAGKQLREIFREQSPEEARQGLLEARDRGRIGLEQKAEMRAIGTGGGATASASGGGGAALVSPFIAMGDYAPYRQYGRAFADQCNMQTLPDYGMVIYIPHITGPAGIGQQTESAAVLETDPTAGYLSGSLVTLAGEVTVSQQLLDRAGPNFSYDRMIFDQLNRAYALQLDSYVLTQVLANATSQNWTGNNPGFDLVAASGSGGFYGQVSKAKASVRTTAGTVLDPSHLFLTDTRWEYIAAWADANGRPVVVPDYAGPYNAIGAGSADGAGVIEGRTGYRFNGLPVFTDQNIPSLGTTSEDQAIVSDMSENYLYEGMATSRVVPQTLVSNLQVILQMFAYVTVIPRYPAGTVSISGLGMGAISYTN